MSVGYDPRETACGGELVFDAIFLDGGSTYWGHLADGGGGDALLVCERAGDTV